MRIGNIFDSISMDLITEVEFDAVKRFPPFGKRFNLCTVSRKNLVAFTAPRCYKLAKGDDNKHTSSVKLTDW